MPRVRVCLAFMSRLPTEEEWDAGYAADATCVCASGHITLYLDPASQRVVYLTAAGDAPTRCFVVERPKQETERVYTPAMLERVEYAGALPKRMIAQNSWNFKLSGNALVPFV